MGKTLAFQIGAPISSFCVAITAPPGGWHDRKDGVRIVEGERRLSHVRVKMRVPWEHWQDIYNEVIDPLAKEGADIICDVNIVAGGEGMIRENTVELGIRESLSQRGIDAQIEAS